MLSKFKKLCLFDKNDILLLKCAIVVIKFTAPNIEAAPDKCNEKIAKSTAPPECAGAGTG
jgi:hypothetical protein